jgi:DNA-binding GntR family transcriptional regulator
VHHSPDNPFMTRGMSELLAQRIERWIAEEGLGKGTPLPERSLAERFKVSRTPIRDALLRLAEQGTIAPREEGGYAVLTPPDLQVLSAPGIEVRNDREEQDYLRIAEDRLSGELPERITENELMRRYGLTRAALAAVLQRIINEGWIERLPGKGWQFLPVLSTSNAYNQGYRLRILLEPAAILEPGFQLDEVGLRRCRDEQQTLVDGAVEWASPAQLFDANSRLHEVIARSSGNVFIVDGLKRVNRLRRLMEYKKDVDRAASAMRCKEHLTLIDLLLTGQREAAADFMRLHLRDAAREKAGQLEKF